MNSMIAACASAMILLTAVMSQAPAPVFRSFDRVRLLEEKSETSAGVNIGDLNGDRLLDIVLGKGRHWSLFNRVLLNDGKGGFFATNLGSAPDRTYSAALADVDGDGKLDIVVSNDAPDRKLVYRNDGKGRFTEFGTFGDPKWSTRYVRLADLNRDGFADIIAANRGDERVVAPSFVCLNDRSGHFPACDALPTESATTIVAADFDDDGKVDLFVPHRDGHQSLMLWGDGKGRFPTATKVGAERAWIRIGAAADLDSDQRPDLVFIEERLGGVFVMFNRGGRQFSDPLPLPGPKRAPYALAVADLNRDGRPDIVVGWVEKPGSVYYNLGNGREYHEFVWNDRQGCRLRYRLRRLRPGRLAGHRGGAVGCAECHLVQHEVEVTRLSRSSAR
ncbi:MAG TPA: VCBS repeat-containing protein [Bryobacteraceae bacterium]|nr:VCBS repeat-containing protein [Bryobacteraceae bacterium]